VTAAILSYHRITGMEMDPWGLRVSPQRFAEQMAALRDIGEPVPLTEVLRPGAKNATGRLRLAVTFDDGYLDNLAAALPVLRRCQVPATMFVASGYSGKSYFWWDVLDQVFLRPNELPPRLRLAAGSFALDRELGGAASYTAEQYAADCRGCVWRGESGSRVRLYHDVYDAIWPIPHADKIELARRLLSWSGLSEDSLADARPMSADELRELARDPLVSLGGHTVNHLRLDWFEPEVQLSEIRDCQAALARLTGRAVESFAYPHGKYLDSTLDILRDCGVRFACTTREARVGAATDPLLLPRMVVKDWDAGELRDRLMALAA
jgi:peptidoglycan/xylan/chitin deacetylase (PgdA/CDA1 family)